MEFQDLIIEYKPNPFTYDWFSTMTNEGQKTDHSGGMGYYYTLAPAEVIEGTKRQSMSGANVRFSPSPSQWADFYWDFVYFGGVRITTQPSGSCVWTIEKPSTSDGRPIFILNATPDGLTNYGPVQAGFHYNVTSAVIDEVDTNGWNLVLRDADANTLVVDSAGVELDNWPYYFVGAYKMSSASSAYADAQMESAFNSGFDEGLREGVATTNGNQSAFDLMGSAFSSVGGMLGVAVLPGITLGTLVAVPLIVTLLVVVVRLLKK